MASTRVNSTLLFDFFLAFARFEFALKASGYFKRMSSSRRGGYRLPEARPDWDCFAVDLKTTFDKNRTEELKEASNYILENPPNRQVILNGAVAWETPIRPQQETDIEFLFRMVRCIRNNLFHGGKHNIEVHEQTQRTEKLLRNSLALLNECLYISHRVRQNFDEVTI